LKEEVMFVIGIDPHKRSHTAAVLDDTEALVGQLRVTADRWQRDRLLRFAAPFEPRTWAVEAAGGLGALLAQQLVAAGERVVDVPPTLSARVRLLDSGRTDKSDPHDARSAAIVALRHARLRPVRPVDHAAVLRLLANRHHDLTAARTRTICRLHALLCLLIPGGFSGRLSARQAAQVLRGLRPVELVDVERKRVALEILGDVRRVDDQLEALVKRIGNAVAASGTTVTDVYGIGPIGAAVIVGHTGDVTRFPSAGHYARYNATAPLEASSGPRVRHRLNPRGNRQLNHALHVAAITQIAHDTAGRAYFLRKIEEGKTRKEALRALKRRISDAVYRQLLVDTRP
jgi:transposase